MTLKTTKWDAIEHLDSNDAIVHYIEAALEESDPGLIAAALGDVARARGMTETAKMAGVTREALYRSLNETGDPRLSTVVGVLKAFGTTLSAKSTQAAE